MFETFLNEYVSESTGFKEATIINIIQINNIIKKT